MRWCGRLDRHSGERFTVSPADELPFADRARILANRFATRGCESPDSVFYTSAMATADFSVVRKEKAYVVGEAKGALIHELYKAGFTITDVNPDLCCRANTSYNWDMMHKAAYFVANGARLSPSTNPDMVAALPRPVDDRSAPVLDISDRKPF